MARKPAQKKQQQFDSLATFTGSLAGYGYRDGPFVGVTGGVGLFRNIYRTSWIARAAVDMIPEDCFKRGYGWVAEAEQVTALEAEEARLAIWEKKRRALSWSRLDGEAYLYFDTGHDASTPLNLNQVRKGGLRFVNALRNTEISRGPVVSDPLSELHGRPEYYTIGTAKIHPSRICEFTNGYNDITSGGVSVLEYMMRPIVAAETARDNTAALTTEALIDVMSVCGLMDAVSDPATEKQLVARYALLRQGKATNKMIVIDKDAETFDRKPSQFTGLPDVIEAMRREVAAAVGVPYSLLFGRPGGLGTNGETELKNYYDNISTMQRNIIQTATTNLDECIIRSALGARPSEIYIEWLSLWEMSDKEKAEVAKIYADAAKVAVDASIVPADVLTESLINSWVEIGAFQGIEQVYKEWVDGGGTVEPPDSETDVPRPTQEEIL